MKSATILAPDGRARLRTWLARSRLTQGEAAAHIGLHRVHLNQILTGERRPGLDLAILLEETTGIPVRAWRKATGSVTNRYVNQQAIADRDLAGDQGSDRVNQNRAPRTSTLRQISGDRKESKSLQGKGPG
jgi:transcriptional regulator with XRE-family HTH domain